MKCLYVVNLSCDSFCIYTVITFSSFFFLFILFFFFSFFCIYSLFFHHSFFSFFFLFFLFFFLYPFFRIVPHSRFVAALLDITRNCIDKPYILFLEVICPWHFVTAY
ncbi:hypothetical protein CW734_05415 [Planococcus sp. MB-3u-03]|nr:hypothetical protein CW734_05415 [Planococcus sp. MB-3u-03]